MAPVNQEQQMQIAVDAIMNLNAMQLVILNAQLSEHIFNVFQYSAAKKEVEKAAKEKEEQSKKNAKSIQN